MSFMTLSHHHGYSVIKKLTVNGIDVTNKIGKSYLEDKVTKEETSDFAIVNIERETTGKTIYELYVFDYSGNVLLQLNDIDNEHMRYDGEYNYDTEEKTIRYVKKLEYDETAGGYYFQLENNIDLDNLSSEDEAFLEKINDAKVYEVKYTENGKFSTPTVKRTIKFNVNYKENKSYKYERILNNNSLLLKD